MYCGSRSQVKCSKPPLKSPDKKAQRRQVAGAAHYVGVGYKNTVQCTLCTAQLSTDIHELAQGVNGGRASAIGKVISYQPLSVYLNGM